MLHCPVYKIYGGPGTFSLAQKKSIAGIIDMALRKTPHLTDELLLLKTLILQTADRPEDYIDKIDTFFRRCMQFTGPLMAKGGEDTAYYTFNRFIVHNEVGDSPSYFGITGEEFHEEMIRRQKRYPFTMNATSTHDTKRGEDARARLTALSDIPEKWISHIEYWRIINRRFKKFSGNTEIPALNDEYFIYQTAAGFMPLKKPESEKFEERLLDYITKALREGKMMTDWSDPNEEYESGTGEFIAAILKKGTEFRISLDKFLADASYLGIINSLSQTIIKLMAPGIPDIYQGNETWNYSFVDPDNRRPVDFAELEKNLDDLISKEIKISDLWNDPFDPRLKLLLVHHLLQLRTANEDVFSKGEYLPLEVRGKFCHLVFAFARRYHEKMIVAVLPVHAGSLFDNENKADIRLINWENTEVLLPEFPIASCKNSFRKEIISRKNRFPVSELFNDVPFALLEITKKPTTRRAGILMHITSLQGSYEIGDLGHEAFNFADFLKKTGQGYWQILPLNQIHKGGGFSPYSPLSAFAGNVYLISPELLAEEKLISDPPVIVNPGTSKVLYENAVETKEKILDTAYERFRKGPFRSLRKQFYTFHKKEEYWLHDYALFQILKKRFPVPWNKWPAPYRDRNKEVLTVIAEENEMQLEREKFVQFLFLRQWKSLKEYCNNLDIRIFGDMPIYISYDSSDVWSHPELFKLKKNKEMLAVAGVPPDYFSKTGQLWNMPVFDWAAMESDGFDWWKNRIRKNLELYDLLRLDHFRGFSAYWEVPGTEKTAARGEWKKGSGEKLFNVLKKEFPDMPFVAEDLGEIDQPVYELRDKYGLPGMKVLQAAFGADGAESIYLPHNYPPDCVVYTGTHDFNTTKGWYKNELTDRERRMITDYLNNPVDPENCSGMLIRLAYSSTARLVIIPIQDIIGLGENARMNTPSLETDNWTWRLNRRVLTPAIEEELIKMSAIFGRM